MPDPQVLIQIDDVSEPSAGLPQTSQRCLTDVISRFWQAGANLEHHLWLRDQLQGLRDEGPSLLRKANFLAARTNMLRVDTFPNGGAPVDEPGWFAADVVLQSLRAKTETETDLMHAALLEECTRTALCVKQWQEQLLEVQLELLQLEVMQERDLDTDIASALQAEWDLEAFLAGSEVTNDVRLAILSGSDLSQHADGAGSRSRIRLNSSETTTSGQDQPYVLWQEGRDCISEYLASDEDSRYDFH